MIPFFEIKSDIKGKKEKEVIGRSVSCRGPPRGRAPPPACGPGRNPSSGTTMPAHRPRRLAHGRGQPKNRDTLPPTFPFVLLPEDSSFLFFLCLRSQFPLSLQRHRQLLPLSKSRRSQSPSSPIPRCGCHPNFVSSFFLFSVLNKFVSHTCPLVHEVVTLHNCIVVKVGGSMLIKSFQSLLPFLITFFCKDITPKFFKLAGLKEKITVQAKYSIL